MMSKTVRRISLIGFGEAGGILAQDFAAAGYDVRITDKLLGFEPSRGAMFEKARRANVQAHASFEDVIQGADVIISAVTCSNALDAAHEALPWLSADQLFVDINSVSPQTKREIARTIANSRARFAEAAVMAPFPPQRLKVPILLAGRNAAEMAASLQSIGLNTTAIGEQVGGASAIKMCRSIIIKGLEALAVEALFAARRYGAENEVLKSLAETFPEMGWDNGLPDYLVSRVAQHGRRRAAEMRHVAETLKEVDLEPFLALATAERQDWLVDRMTAQAISYGPGTEFSWRRLSDRVGPGKQTSVEVRNTDSGGLPIGS